MSACTHHHMTSTPQQTRPHANPPTCHPLSRVKLRRKRCVVTFVFFEVSMFGKFDQTVAFPVNGYDFCRTRHQHIQNFGPHFQWIKCNRFHMTRVGLCTVMIKKLLPQVVVGSPVLCTLVKRHEVLQPVCRTDRVMHSEKNLLVLQVSPSQSFQHRIDIKYLPSSDFADDNHAGRVLPAANPMIAPRKKFHQL